VCVSVNECKLYRVKCYTGDCKTKNYDFYEFMLTLCDHIMYVHTQCASIWLDWLFINIVGQL
jgi:hypothetical protein